MKGKTGAQHFRRVPRPEMPSGEQLVGELEEAARAKGMTTCAFVDALCTPGQKPTNWLSQMLRTKCPRPHTVERIRCLIDGLPIPPVPERKHGTGMRRGRVLPADRRVREIDSEVEEAVARRLEAGRLTTRNPLPVTHRELTPEERLAEASDVIRFAVHEWPAVAAEVKAYAQETEQSLGDAWRSVITAGLQCLREAD